MVNEVFGNILKEVKKTMLETGHQNVVDLEMSFESLEIDKKGGLFVPKRSQKREMSLKLATRVSPEVTA